MNKFTIYFLADSALNRVKQGLQFLRPPPPKTASNSNTQLPVDVDTTAITNFDDTINNDAAMAELISNNQHHSLENDEDMVSSIFVLKLYFKF